jgi:hypothetical protein
VCITFLRSLLYICQKSSPKPRRKPHIQKALHQFIGVHFFAEGGEKGVYEVFCVSFGEA